MVPQSGDRHCGGPIWPNFSLQIRARTCWGSLPFPIDMRPRLPVLPRRVIEVGFWCGIVGLHYGHMIADFGMRIVDSAAADPNLPLIFSLPDVPGFVPPPYFWEMIDVLGVDRGRIVLVTEPVIVGTLHVFAQAERLYGGGPSAAHLDRMDRLLGNRAVTRKNIACLYVSRARVLRGGQIAGESYIEEVLGRLGVEIFHPEAHSVAAQIAIYARAQRLIFSEGSAVHTLQLVGRLGADVAILVRRPWRWFGRALLHRRVRSLTHLQAVDTLIRGQGPSPRSERHRGISVLDETRLIRAFQRIGLDLAPHWIPEAFRESRDCDIRAWIARRRAEPRPENEAAFVDAQLSARNIPIRYHEAG